MKSRFKIMLLLAAVLAAHCTESSREGPLAGTELSKALMSLSEEARVGLNLSLPSPQAIEPELTKLRRTAQRRLGKLTGPQAVAGLNRFLFQEMGFVREVDDRDIRFMLLPWVIQKRRGSCLGLAGLYLVLARDLGLEVYGVMVPGHFFLRLSEQGMELNIELLRQGEGMPDDWYRQKWPYGGQPLSYLRPLSDSETVAVFYFNLGNGYRAGGDLPHAARSYDRATGMFEQFAEAHASRGLVCQLAQDEDCARRAYLRARDLHPELPGLEQNMKAMQQEPEKPGSGVPAPMKQQQAQHQGR